MRKWERQDLQHVEIEPSYILAPGSEGAYTQRKLFGQHDSWLAISMHASEQVMSHISVILATVLSTGLLY
jgi:hypothetical protein